VQFGSISLLRLPFVFAASWSFSRISSLSRKCLTQCEGLRARADSSATSASDNASGLIVALIEELVHEKLPFPACAEMREARSFSWMPMLEDAPFTTDSQRSLCRVLFQLSLQYSAAMRNLPSSRAAYGARVLTLSALVVLLDATVRVTDIALSEPSALASVLCGGRVSSVADDSSVAYGLSLISNAVMPFEEVTAALLLVRPELLRTRETVMRYSSFINRDKPLLPLTFVPLGAATGGSASIEDVPDILELPEEDATFQLIQDLCEATGHHNDLPKGNERAARRLQKNLVSDDVPDLERRGAWLAEDWPDVPEFALYRDALLMFRLAAEPLAALPRGGDGGRVAMQAWSAAFAAPRIRFIHLDFSKKNVGILVTFVRVHSLQDSVPAPFLRCRHGLKSPFSASRRFRDIPACSRSALQLPGSLS
jgi:hypothetical protein